MCLYGVLCMWLLPCMTLVVDNAFMEETCSTPTTSVPGVGYVLVRVPFLLLCRWYYCFSSLDFPANSWFGFCLLHAALYLTCALRLSSLLALIEEEPWWTAILVCCDNV